MINFNTIFGWIALISSSIILIQLLLSIFFGSLDLDIDADGDIDIDLSVLISPKGVLQFLAGSCWYLVLKTPHLWYDWLIAILFGLALVLLMFLVYKGMYRLATDPVESPGESIVGESGEIYLSLGKGNYLISTVISGSKRTISVSGPENLKTGDIIVITSFKNNIYYIEQQSI